ncbi:hypothetical protein [Actinoalloteichus sp. GBA129-24]|uniref:hypothetical protein n=1 Tax=Actinoalloteichus sp. GBA129-24 TaxID=1612551 RepID=UPI0009504748|nr:hypothetical protein [Actinoalloteichus sp. GBA129-24]APU20930.1 hypothetical protein UA75_14600 [Actinoalloteichus sp. GBA129-24]
MTNDQELAYYRLALLKASDRRDDKEQSRFRRTHGGVIHRLLDEHRPDGEQCAAPGCDTAWPCGTVLGAQTDLGGIRPYGS